MIVNQFQVSFQLDWGVSNELETKNSSKLNSTKSKFKPTFTNGSSGSNKIDHVHEILLELAPSANDEIDLTDLVDMLTGDTFAFDVVKFLCVTIEKNTDETISDKVVVEPGASNGWLGYWEQAGSKQSVFKGIGYVTGDPVTGIDVDATHKTLKVSNSDSVNDASVRIVLSGFVV